MVLIVPLATLLATLSTPIIMLYRAGRFTAEDVPIVAGVLLWWALALPFYAGYMYVLKSFYSLQDTATPMYTNMATTVVQVGLYALLVRGVGAWGGLGIIGIPMADGIFFFIHISALLVILRRREGAFDGRAIARTFAKVAIASAAGGLAAWTLLQLTSALTARAGGFLVQLGVTGIAGLAVSYVAMTALKVPELSMVTGRLTRRFGKRKA
jgi:putative peptidoglycan lipid II flippase